MGRADDFEAGRFGPGCVGSTAPCCGWTLESGSRGERARLATRSDAEQSRWWLWAAKEATFKAVRGVDPGVPFRPRCFQVEIAGGAGRSVHACACNGGRCVAVRIDAERVHAGEALVSISHHGRFVACAIPARAAS